MTNPKRVGRHYRHCDVVGMEFKLTPKPKEPIKDAKIVNGVLTDVERVEPINQGLKYTDFSVGSLQQANAYNLLANRVSVDGSTMNNVDAIEKTIIDNKLLNNE